MGGREGNLFDLANLHFMFLIDMKFIFKLLKNFLRGSSSFVGPRLRLFMFSQYYPSIKSKSKNRNLVIRHEHLRFPRFRKFSNFHILRYEELIFPKDHSTIFLYFLK